MTSLGTIKERLVEGPNGRVPAYKFVPLVTKLSKEHQITLSPTLAKKFTPENIFGSGCIYLREAINEMQTGPGVVKLTVIRHAQTPHNKKKIFQGDTNTPLSTHGKLQADLTGDFLSNEHVDTIIMTELERTQKTAEAIISRLKQNDQPSIFSYGQLNERRLGELTLVPLPLILKPQAHIITTGNEISVSHLPLGGENVHHMQNRAEEVAADIKQGRYGNHVVVVLHYISGKCIIGKLLGLNAREIDNMVLDNASISRFLIFPHNNGSNEHSIIGSMNFTGHLKPAKAIENIFPLTEIPLIH